MFPWLAHGHVFPFLELAKKLSSRSFHIHFCSTRINLEAIKKDSISPYSIELVELNIPSLPELPPHYYTNKNVPPSLMPLLLQAFQMSAPAFAAIVAEIKPDLLIYDGFQPWAAKAAAAHAIPAVFFSVANSPSLAFFHHMYTHKNPHSFPHDAIRLKDYELRDLIEQSKYIEQFEEKDEGFLFAALKLSSEIVCRGVEEKYADYLSELSSRKVLFTGSLVSDPRDHNSEVMKWLGERKRGSTLYISFGMEKTEANFVWVARAPGADVPEGKGEGGGGARRRYWPMGAWGVHDALRVELDHGERVVRGFPWWCCL